MQVYVWDDYKCVYMDVLSAATFDEAKALCGQRIDGANLLVIVYRCAPTTSAACALEGRSRALLPEASRGFALRAGRSRRR